jgi:hypothetical protein
LPWWRCSPRALPSLKYPGFRPQGISGRDVIRDKAVCRSLSDQIWDGRVDYFLYKAIEKEVRRDFSGCMTEAGYTKVIR